ncbi:hypothetical protein EHQ53_16560 [Leptospira langatensis]|uniref:Uncharacterized protein n=1 Tax=Leptospira langatensis TaxID=2484983 RepID=A0A5F1ZQT4_9LEPT|nr:hypothetical protein [Leptospira langatensis]TGK05254.1 hypothetical protein EHO57_00800 [Leptospira langatensis]TGL38390.1 hypothetical protein EHQ53_16560 [Leptospira langatensis]
MIIPLSNLSLLPLFFCIYSCFSVEFVADGVPKPGVIRSHRKSWEEVEILKQAPRKRSYKTYGKVVIRNFADGKITKFYMEKIKRELFDRGMDGMYLTNTAVVPIPPTIFQTGSAEGYTTNMSEIARDAKVLEANAFRYRDREEE